MSVNKTSKRFFMAAFPAAIVLAGLLILANRGTDDERRAKAASERFQLFEILCEGLTLRRWLPQDVTKEKEGASHSYSWRFTDYFFSAPDLEPPPLGKPWYDQAYADYDGHFLSSLHCLDRDAASRPRKRRFTRVMAVTSVNSVWHYAKKSGWSEVKRIASDAISIVEVRNSTTPWMAAGDLSLDDARDAWGDAERFGIGSDFGDDSFLVGFVDGQAWRIRSDVPFDILEQFLTVDAAAHADRSTLLAPFRVL